MLRWIGLFLLMMALPLAAQDGPVDVKIVLSVDASGSVEPRELRLQIGGVAAALRDTRVQDVVRAGPFGQVLAVLQIWSDASYPKHTTRWYRLSDSESFEAMAQEVETYLSVAPGVPAIGGGGTNIGDALVHALGMIADEPTRALRSVIDVSGDGPETRPWVEGAVLLPQARAMATARGVTVNALAIENEEPLLRLYYRDELITGPGAFVETARNYQDYQDAIIRKLLRELGTQSIDAVRLDPTRCPNRIATETCPPEATGPRRHDVHCEPKRCANKGAPLRWSQQSAQGYSRRQVALLPNVPAPEYP